MSIHRHVGEGGVEWPGGPLWSPAVPPKDVNPKLKNNHYYSSMETTNVIQAKRQFAYVLPPLTLPPIAPPLPNVVGIAKGSWQVVMRAFARDREVWRAVERDERKVRQVDLVNLTEELLA